MLPENLSRADLEQYAQIPLAERPGLPAGVTAKNILEKTRYGVELSRDEIFGFIKGFTYGDIPDYQAAVLLDRILLKGITPRETFDLTLAMAASGEILNLDEFGIVTDKHSSGGVGDKTTLVVAPLVAACGLNVGKMSGRGLGHTGGTLDKLESIPGFRVDLNTYEFKSQLAETGIVVTGQTGELAPADGKLYALRDVTDTIDSIPLIAASIMSKKIASGANHLVLDVKVGEGAFMKTLEDARELAQTMVDIGKAFGIKIEAEISDMSQPLGNAVGNAIEVLEAVNTLQRHGPPDLHQHCIDTAARIVLLAGKAKNMMQAHKEVLKAILDGSALEKFREMVIAQGGDGNVVDNPKNVLKIAKYWPIFFQGNSGYVHQVNPMDVGLTAMKLGAGRQKKGDPIDHSVGVAVYAKVGDKLENDQFIGAVYTNNQQAAMEAVVSIRDAFTIGVEEIEPPPLIHEVIF